MTPHLTFDKKKSRRGGERGGEGERGEKRKERGGVRGGEGERRGGVEGEGEERGGEGRGGNTTSKIDPNGWPLSLSGGRAKKKKKSKNLKSDR